MQVRHKHKAVATLLAVFLGGLGTHRFYLAGPRDLRAWAYACTGAVYAAYFALCWAQDTIGTSVVALFPLPVFAAWVEALVMGLTADTIWDARHNRQSGLHSTTQWPLIALLVCTLLGGYTVLIACLARATDLLYTGGAFG